MRYERVQQMLGIFFFTTIAFFISIILAVTNNYLNKKDETIEEVLALLPGYNCGSCGFGGCPDMALNIVKNGADPKRCKPMKEEQYKKLEAYLKSE